MLDNKHVRWRNIGKKIAKHHGKGGNMLDYQRFKIGPKGAQTIKIGLYFLP